MHRITKRVEDYSAQQQHNQKTPAPIASMARAGLRIASPMSHTDLPHPTTVALRANVDPQSQSFRRYVFAYAQAEKASRTMHLGRQGQVQFLLHMGNARAVYNFQYADIFLHRRSVISSMELALMPAK